MAKLIYLANQRLPSEKAYGIQIAKMCEAFASAGSQVDLIFPHSNWKGDSFFDFYKVKKNFSLATVKTVNLWMSGPLEKVFFYIKYFFSALSLSLYALRHKADFIYSRDELSVFLLSFFRKKNVVFEAHKFSARRAVFYRRFIRKHIKIVVISEGLKNEFIKFSFDQSRLLVAHDGVDLSEFNIPETSHECRRRLNLPDKKLLGYVGQLKTMGMEKGIGTLIDAFGVLKKTFPELMLVVVGGSEADIVFYKSYAKFRGIKEGIIFVGRREHGAIPFYLKAFDILIMPFPDKLHYARHMSPLKMFEYMASGRPIVTTDLPAIREVLGGDNSVIVEPGNANGLSEGIKTLLNNSALADKISGKALEIVKEFTWEKRAKKILEFFDRALWL